MSTKATRIVAILVSLLLVAVTVTGCGSKPNASNSLTYAVGTDAKTLDPQFVNDLPSAVAAMQIHETLVARDENMNLVPGLATEWSVSSDGKTWTFKLRKGVKFHDGTDFNADAVKYTLDRMLDKATASPRRSVVSMITGVKVVDASTVQITTDQPFGPFLAQLSTYNVAMMSPTAAKAAGVKGYGQKPVGTGPFKFKSWTPGEKLVLERNDSYWGTKPTIKELTFKVVPEDATRVMLLKTGDAQVVGGVPAFQIDDLKKDANITLIAKPGFRTIYVGMNNSQKPFDDPRVRQAVNYAIDREAIVKNLLRGQATIAVGPESTTIPGAAKTLQTVYTHDVAKAKQLLKDAGYPDGFKTVFHTPSGRYPMDQQVSEAIVGQLKEAGIQAELKVMDWGAYNDMLTKGTESRLFLLGKGSPSADPDMTLSLSFGTKASMNQAFYSNKQVDGLLADQRKETNADKRAQILQQIQDLVQKDAAWANLYYETITVGTRANVKGLQVLPNELIFFNKVTIGK